MDYNYHYEFGIQCGSVIKFIFHWNEKEYWEKKNLSFSTFYKFLVAYTSGPLEECMPSACTNGMKKSWFHLHKNSEKQLLVSWWSEILCSYGFSSSWSWGIHVAIWHPIMHKMITLRLHHTGMGWVYWKDGLNKWNCSQLKAGLSWWRSWRRRPFKCIS